MIGAEVPRISLSNQNLVEQSTQRRAIDVACVNRETDNSAGELIHDDHYPVTAEQNRLATEQVDAPQAVFRVPEEG